MASPRPLGRKPPTDFRHVEKYPLTAAPTTPQQVPVVLGVNWYSNFDDPVRDGRDYWIGRGDLGHVRGGHAICAVPDGARDSAAWWTFYDQGSEGACVGFSASRMMSLLNRRRYDARWLYLAAQKIDEWPGEDYSGTSVRAAMDVLRTRGHVRTRGTESVVEGISANRWATTVDEVLTVLDSPTVNRKGAIRLANSWGRDYPHFVWLPLEVLARLIAEDGEIALVVDR